jgi:hypothetical protein
MNAIKTAIFLATVTLAVNCVQAGEFKIAGFVFDEANAVTSVAIVEGPLTLMDHSNKRFGKYSENYLSAGAKVNEFQAFDRSKTIGRLLGRGGSGDLARHLSFPSPGDDIAASPMPNVHRCAIECTWGSNGLGNGPGPDFVVYEAGSWEGFAVAVRKAGSPTFTGYRYQFPAGQDKTHDTTAVAFDLSKFGLAEGETISAIRIRNLFNSKSRGGGDKVDEQSGEGWIIYPGDPRYKDAFMLRNGAGGSEFPIDKLGSDIVYVVGLQKVAPLKTQTVSAQPEDKK